MRLRPWTTWLFLALAACGGAPPPRPAVPPPEEPHEEPQPEPEEEPAAPEPEMVTIETEERSRPPSTASYEQALATPERLDPNDERPHLTDSQLRAPMHGVLVHCRIPSNAKVTIKTAVQNGRAIGVTVDVRFEHKKTSPPPKKLSPAAQKRAAKAAEREAKAKKKLAACIDHVVRMAVWPPSNRRDSFTTEF